MILRGVEDNIEHHVNDGPRKRMRADSITIRDDEENTEDAMNKSTHSTSSVIRMSLQLDEAKLQNEELTDKLKAERDAFTRDKEKFIRQLQFLENENTSLKSEVEDRKERYYAIKKKLQTTVRAAEMEKQELEQKLSKLSTNSAVGSGSSARSKTQLIESDQWAERLSELESSVQSKTNETKRLALKNAELEERCGKLEQEIVSLRANSSSTDTPATTRALQKQVSDLEATLRRRSREMEKLEHQLQNQHILEQDLSCANQKIHNMRVAAKLASETEARCNELLKEKEAWTLHFREIVQQMGDDGAPSSDAPVTPVLVLRLLSSVQRRCASLLHAQAELEGSNAELRSKLSQRESELDKARRDLEETSIKVQRLEHTRTMHQQQAKLYEGEVMSLRALLKTFDVEFDILRHAKGATKSLDSEENSHTNALMKHKDTMLSDLRQELDELRLERQRHIDDLLQAEQKAATLEDKLAKTSAGPEGGTEVDKREKRYLKNRCDALTDELLALQHVTGVDFIPGRTRVLHLKNNPSLQRFQPGGGIDAALRGSVGDSDSDAGGQLFMTPMDELRHLRKEMKRLQVQHQQQSHAGGLPGDTPAPPTIPQQQMDTSISQPSTASVVDSQKLNARLKEMFRERINSYREAVYLLFGYKVELYSADSVPGGHPQLKLKSLYAENPDDSLIFQWKDDVLELMETPFAASLDEHVMQTLRSSNAVPVFLANVSLDLFEKQTFMG